VEMTRSNDRPRTEAEVEAFLADLEEDQHDRQELEQDDDLKSTDRAPSTDSSTSSTDD